MALEEHNRNAIKLEVYGVLGEDTTFIQLVNSQRLLGCFLCCECVRVNIVAYFELLIAMEFFFYSPGGSFITFHPNVRKMTARKKALFIPIEPQTRMWHAFIVSI